MADWSRAEVEATVADYFAMLETDARDEPLNKAEHNRSLRAVLNGRSHGAVERKHQNISAILLQLGFTYLSGYVPLGNYQRLLREVVEDRLQRAESLQRAVAAFVELSGVSEPLEDILAAHVPAPRPRPGLRRPYPRRVAEGAHPRPGVDYLALEARNRKLGAEGERWVLQFEQARLSNLRRDDLAAQVERVSETRGDGLGYDILSFERTGAERLIEVKTTASGAYMPFRVTSNEVAVSRERRDEYHLYRVFSFRRSPRVYWKSGQLDREFMLDPEVFRARIA